jgi:hypothetical protein
MGTGLTWGGSIFVNPIMARVKDPRWITAVGAVLIFVGYALASFSHKVSEGGEEGGGEELTWLRFGSCC